MRRAREAQSGAAAGVAIPDEVRFSHLGDVSAARSQARAFSLRAPFLM
jgi:hypothetical protein